MMRSLLFSLLIFILSSTAINAQFGYGFTGTWSLYDRYTNPSDDVAYESAGSAILNFGVGPKLWLGNRDFSISAEASAQINFLGLALKDYKGMGMASFPMLVNLNFNGLSGFDNELRPGFSIGGGIQFSKTELYGLSNKYKRDGVERKLFRTYLIHAAYGFGLNGESGALFLRYGFNPDNSAKTLSLGFQVDMNHHTYKNRIDPASQL